MSELSEKIARVRQRAGCGVMDARRALFKTSGDEEAAIDILRVAEDWGGAGRESCVNVKPLSWFEKSEGI